MLRYFIVLFLFLSLCFVHTPDLNAHGGSFRGPGGGVPPDLREPGDPSPPPPPPPSPRPGPDVTPPTPVPPSTGGRVGPITPPTVPNSNGGQPQNGQRSGPRAASLDYTNWRFWWGYNQDAILGLKDAIYRTGGTGSTIHGLGDASPDARSDATHMVRAEIEKRVLPTLLWVIDPKNKVHADIESAAYLALAKTARMPSQIAVISKALDPKAGHRDLVTESAALALGLLARTHKDEQFTGVELDRVRDILFHAIKEGDHKIRTRGFALLALGLLGDQPTGSATTDQATKANATTQALFEILATDETETELAVPTLVAIGLQDVASLTTPQREHLRMLVLSRGSRGASSELTRAYAAQALGRIGTAKDVGVLQTVLAGRSYAKPAQRSAAIGVGTLARLLSSQERAAVVSNLLGRMRRFRDVSTRNFLTISIAYHLQADHDSDATQVLSETKAGSWLVSEARSGSHANRPYAALALGLVARAVGDMSNSEGWGTLRDDALQAIREGLTAKDLPHSARGAFATALGIAKDERSIPRLGELVDDERQDPSLRGYAAAAIGMMGHAPKRIRVRIREALAERRTEEMRVQCATALGLLHDTKAVPELIASIRTARNQSTKGQLLVALARIGDERAVQPLVDLVRAGRSEQNLTRALACASLGIVGDLESVPVLSRLSKDVNYRAGTNVMREVLSIL
ncbi:MAG: HEAT repeat domain-containing protein [bacterium]|nr:HEAT repeat domain-containing protein [bacterium]